MEKTALIVLADGFEEIEAVTPIDLLRRAGITVIVAGLSTLEVRGSHGITVRAETLLGRISSLPDALVLPGGPGHKSLLQSAAVLEFVNKTFSAGKLCAAICAAPVVFGRAGILANKRATCFTGEEDKLGGAIFVEDNVVADGNIITSRGAGTAVPFSLEIVAWLAGREKAEAVATAIVYL
jgi:4-methyl-5(b-hydroxyethyl)-thiazole monophosphate biosynthesis